MRKGIIIGIIVFLMSFALVNGADDFISGIHLYSTDIVAYQDLSYSTCVEGNNVKTRVYCYDTKDSIDLPAIDGGTNCYYSSVDLSRIPCTDLEIQSTYQQDGISKRLTKRISLKKTLSNPSGILDKQNWDGGWETPSNTAYAIWILSNYTPKYNKQIDEGLNWLKEQRLEDEKCWPGTNGKCSIYETSLTLLHLKYAGYNVSEKIYQDGIKWLDSQMNFIESGQWTLVLSPSDNDNCTITIGTSATDYEVEEDEDLEIYFSPTYDSKINVSCDDINENVVFLDAEDRYVELNYNNENDTRVYSIPEACWSSSDKWDNCNRKTTLYSSLLDDIDEDKLDLAQDWLVEELRASNVVGKYLSTGENVFDTSLFLYDLDADSDILDELEDWLIHSQNNDGSWAENSSQKVKATGYALLALKERDFYGKTEVLNDGFSWLSANYPTKGWDSFSDEAISFLLLRETAKAFLKSDTSPIILDSASKTISLTNPTGFDLNKLTYSVSGDLSDTIKVSGDSEIKSFESGKATVSMKNVRAGKFSGLLKINNNETEVLSIPIIATQNVELAIEPVKEDYYFFSEAGKISFRIKSNADFKCEVSVNEQNLSLQNSFDAKKDGIVNLNAVLGNLASGTYTGNFNCVYDKSNFDIPFVFNVKYFDQEPISVKKDHFKLKRVGQNATVKIKNNLDVPVTVDFSFMVESLYLTLGKRTTVIEPFGTFDLDIINLAVPFDNSTSIEDLTTILIKSFDIEKSVEIELDVTNKQKGSIWGKLIFLIFIFLALLGAWYYFENYYKKDAAKSKKKTKLFSEKVAEFKKELRNVLPEKYKKYIPKSPEEFKAEKDAMKQDIQKSHLKDMVVVMKKLEKSELEIEEKLSNEGLSKEEVTEIIRQVNMDQKLQKSFNSEEQTLKIVQSLDQNNTAKTNLKEQGFSDTSITDAFEELQHTLLKKEETLKKQMKNGDDNDASEGKKDDAKKDKK